MGSVNSGPGKEKKMPNRILDENESIIKTAGRVFLKLLGGAGIIIGFLTIATLLSAFMAGWTPY